MNKNIEPCPFCDGEAKLFIKCKRKYGLTIWCECTKCHARTTGYRPQDNIESFDLSRRLAIARWNNRINK